MQLLIILENNAPEKKKHGDKCGLHDDRWTKNSHTPTNFKIIQPVKLGINKHKIKSPDNNYYEIEQENGKIIRINNDGEIFSENNEYIGNF